MGTVHIVGAGIAGLAAATKLAQAQVPVKLYEATSGAGGRARSSRDAKLGPTDHGLHLIGSDSRELFAYLERIEARDRLHPTPSPLPLPFAPLIDYAELLRFWLRPMAGFAAENVFYAEWVKPFARIWLHGEAGDTPPHQLARGIGASLASRQYFTAAEESIGEALVTPALDYLEYHGAGVYFGHALKSFTTSKDGIILQFSRKKAALDAGDVLIIAAGPTSLGLFGDAHALPTHAAITYHFAIDHREANGIFAIADGPADLVRYRPGRIALSLRLANRAWSFDADELARRLWRWVGQRHPYLWDRRVPDYVVRREKQAGHVPQANPASLPALPPDVFLAGDWVDATLPGTLERAAASGHRAAEAALQCVGPRPKRRQSKTDR